MCERGKEIREKILASMLELEKMHIKMGHDKIP
jgi:hypothetical protein